MNQKFNINSVLMTVLTSIVLAVLVWIGNTVVETRDHVHEIQVHQSYNSLRLERLETAISTLQEKVKLL
jgi:regulatory protein YycH of two-component signal transduction system YycFG